MLETITVDSPEDTNDMSGYVPSKIEKFLDYVQHFCELAVVLLGVLLIVLALVQNGAKILPF